MESQAFFSPTATLAIATALLWLSTLVPLSLQAGSVYLGARGHWAWALLPGALAWLPCLAGHALYLVLSPEVARHHAGLMASLIFAPPALCALGLVGASVGAWLAAKREFSLAALAAAFALLDGLGWAWVVAKLVLPVGQGLGQQDF